MCKRSQIDRGNNTTKRLQHKGAFRIQQIFLIGDDQTNNDEISFLFSFFFQYNKMLSQLESIKQKYLSTVLSSFSFLSFSLTWEKCLSAGLKHVTKFIHQFNYWGNRIFSFSFFLFWIHITFQYFGIVKGKRFKLYLSLTGFQYSDFFLSFLRGSDLPGVGGYQLVFLTLTSVPNSVQLFLRVTFPGVG